MMTELNLNKVEKVAAYFIEGCAKLKKIEIPSTVNTIDLNAFNSASATSQIIIHRKENAISGSPFGSPFGLRAIEWVGDN